MSAIKKLASQTAIYGLSSIIGRVAMFGLTPLLTLKILWSIHWQALLIYCKRNPVYDHPEPRKDLP